MGLLSAIACGLLLVRIPLASPVSNNLLMPGFLPCFVMGVGFHALALRADWSVGAFLISIGTLELLAQNTVGVRDAVPIGVVVLVPLLFAVAIWFPPIVSVLSCKPMVMIGVASYGLYLIHHKRWRRNSSQPPAYERGGRRDRSGCARGWVYRRGRSVIPLDRGARVARHPCTVSLGSNA